MASIVYFDMSGSFTHPKCYSAGRSAVALKLVAAVVIVPVVVSLGMIVELAGRLPSKKVHDESSSVAASNKMLQKFGCVKLHPSTLNIVTAMLLSTYPMVFRSLVSFFDCNHINGEYFLDADDTIRCLDATWLSLLPLSCVLIVYAIGIPVLFWKLMKRLRVGATPADTDVISSEASLETLYRNMGFLCQKYHPTVYFNELLLLARTCGVVAVKLVLSRHYQHQLIVTTMILFVSGMLQIRLEGYRTGALNRLEAIFLLLTILQCTAGLLLGVVMRSEDENLNWLRDAVSYAIFYGCITIGLVYSAVVWSQNMKIVKKTGAFNLKDVTAAHRTMGFRLRRLLPNIYSVMVLINTVIYLWIAGDLFVSGAVSVGCVVIIIQMYRFNKRILSRSTQRKVSMIDKSARMTSILPKIIDLENHLALAAPGERSYVVQTVYETVSLDLCKSPFPFVDNEKQRHVIESTLKSMNDFKFNVAVLILLDCSTEAIGIALTRGGKSSDSAFGFPALHFAVPGSDALARIDFLLHAGADIDGADKNGNTALYIALMMELPEVADCLIERGASLDCLNDKNWSIVHIAAKHGFLEVAELLQRSNADVNLTNSEQQTALFLATAYGHLEIVKLLTGNGADIDQVESDGTSPLNAAAQMGEVDTARFLCSAGAALEVRDTSGRTALFNAAAEGHTEVMEVLLEEYGADIHSTDNTGATAVFAAAENGCLEAVEFLIEEGGAHFDTAAENGRTPLFAAAVCNHVRTVEYLLEKGATALVTDNHSLTPLYAAAQLGHTDVLQSLFTHSYCTEPELVAAVKEDVLEALQCGECSTSMHLATLLHPASASIRGFLEYITNHPIDVRCAPEVILGFLDPEFDESMSFIGHQLVGLGADMIDDGPLRLIQQLCCEAQSQLPIRYWLALYLLALL